MSMSPKRATWYAAFEAHVLLTRLLDDELQRDCGIPLDWYDVLIKLWIAPDKSLRMSELAEQVLLSRSWLTRRVMQLEGAGLVKRHSADSSDRRAVVATMTAEGQRVFAALERSHSRSIDKHFSAYMTTEEAAVIRRVFQRIGADGRAALLDPPGFVG